MKKQKERLNANVVGTDLVSARKEIISNKSNANFVGVAPLGDPHFEEHAKNTPRARLNPNSNISLLTSNHRGITLIALIITIIVMLILVGVTISVSLNGGLFTTTKDAVNKTQVEADKEILQEGVIGALNEELKIANAESLKNNLPEGWEVTGVGPYIATSPNGNKFDVDIDGNITLNEPATGDLLLLEKYFLGENEEGRDLSEVMDLNNFTTFYDDPNTIPDASKSISVIGSSQDIEILSEQSYRMKVYIKYKEKLYALQLIINADIEKAIGEQVLLMYEQKGREGQTVSYSYDGTEKNKKEWLVLYDEGEYVEIVNLDVMGSLTLGATATEISNREKAINSYNSAITTINNYCEKLITNPNKISVRSLGSNPNNPSSENTTKYTSESDMFKNYFSGYVIESGDENYESDYLRLILLNQAPSQICWLASRKQPRIEYDGRVCIRTLDNNFYLGGEDAGAILKCARTDIPMSGTSQTYGVCPVVKISSDQIK